MIGATAAASASPNFGVGDIDPVIADRSRSALFLGAVLGARLLMAGVRRKTAPALRRVLVALAAQNAAVCPRDSS